MTLSTTYEVLNDEDGSHGRRGYGEWVRFVVPPRWRVDGIGIMLHTQWRMTGPKHEVHSFVAGLFEWITRICLLYEAVYFRFGLEGTMTSGTAWAE